MKNIQFNPYPIKQVLLFSNMVINKLPLFVSSLYPNDSNPIISPVLSAPYLISPTIIGVSPKLLVEVANIYDVSAQYTGIICSDKPL
ncbi:MAG: hypothetical protein ACKVHD_04285 [Alphaproteobacteria bacterium]